MISVFKPSDEKCNSILAGLESANLNYAEFGCLKRETPRGFNRDKASCVVGEGASAWKAAVTAIEQWRFMPGSMVEIKNAGPIKSDHVVGVLLRAMFVWSLNPARILEVHGSHEPTKTTTSRFGFTYGTLDGHVEQGEERFLVSWDHATDKVAYEIEAVSRPKHILAWFVYPYARMMQAKFRRESCAAMMEAVRLEMAS